MADSTTHLLYDSDAYLRDFSARVLEVEESRVLLDRTAFFPAGGGQPADRGAIIHNGVVRGVTDVRKRSGRVWHSFLGPPPPTGEEVLCHVDWTRRYALMRTHTALHILGAVVRRDYGREASGGDMRPLTGRLDFEFEDLDLEIANAIEAAVNSEVRAGLEVSVSMLPRAVAARIPDLARARVDRLPPEIQKVRVVEIGGLDIQIDGGTHVASTAEIGPVTLVGQESRGRRTKQIRIELQPEPAGIRAPSS